MPIKQKGLDPRVSAFLDTLDTGMRAAALPFALGMAYHDVRPEEIIRRLKESFAFSHLRAG